MAKIKHLTLFAFSFLTITTMKSMEGPEETSTISFYSLPAPHFAHYVHSVPQYLYSVENKHHTSEECKNYETALKMIETILKTWKHLALEEYIALQVLAPIYLIMQGYLKDAAMSFLSSQVLAGNNGEMIFCREISSLLNQQLITKQQFFMKEKNPLDSFICPERVQSICNLFLKKNADLAKTNLYKSARPEEVIPLLEKAFTTLQSMLEKKAHPVVCASYIHNQITTIHGFKAGNGRIARLMLNFILMRYGYSPIKICNTPDYREHLRQGDEVFACFIIEKLEEVKMACHTCGKNTENKKSKCSRCLSARYCSIECQKTAWNNGHKNICQKEN